MGGGSLPAAAPAGVGFPAPSSWRRRRQKAETAEEQISGQIIQQGSPESSEVKGQNLSSHGLHAGLQVSEQVEALVKEGELGVDEGEHLRNQIVNAAHKNNKTNKVFYPKRCRNNSQSSRRRCSVGF